MRQFCKLIPKFGVRTWVVIMVSSYCISLHLEIGNSVSGTTHSQMCALLSNKKSEKGMCFFGVFKWNIVWDDSLIWTPFFSRTLFPDFLLLWMAICCSLLLELTVLPVPNTTCQKCVLLTRRTRKVCLFKVFTINCV